MHEEITAVTGQNDRKEMLENVSMLLAFQKRMVNMEA